MNTLLPQFQSGQTHFGGYQLLRQMGTDAVGMATWLAQRGAETFLLHVLPIQRLLSDGEKMPLISLLYHGQHHSHAAQQMTLRDVCVEEGQRPITALVEAFPPLPKGATEWLTLVEWTAHQGPATTAQITPHLTALSRWLRETPAGRHGSLSPERIWVAGVGGSIDSVAIAGAGLADLQKRMPEMCNAAATWDDVSGLGHVLYLWLTGKTPTPQNHRDVLTQLNNAHRGEKRTPDHWQRLVASNVDEDATYHSSSVTEMVETLLKPLQTKAVEATVEAEPTPAKPTQDRVSKAVSVMVVVLLSFALLYWMNQSRPQKVISTAMTETNEPAPQPKAPDLKPRINPAPEVVENEPTKASPALTPTEEKPALLPAPPQPEKGAIAQSNPPPPIVRPKAKEAMGTAATSLPERTKLAVNETKIRIPYRPPPPPSQTERPSVEKQHLNSEQILQKAVVPQSSLPQSTRSLSEQKKRTIDTPKVRQNYQPPPLKKAEKQTALMAPDHSQKSAAPTAGKQQPDPEPTAPKAVPIARALVAPESSQAQFNPSPRVVLALPMAEPLVQAVPEPEEQPAPNMIQRDVAPTIPAPPRRDQVRPLILPKGFVPPRGPDKPLWVRP